MSDDTDQRKGRVLIIEDDALVRAYIERGLLGRGYRVTATAAPQQAIELVALEDPDVVLTDLRLGSESGLDLCARLLELNARLPVVIMTGYGNMETAIAAIRAGAYDFINKPIDLVPLDLVLERALRQRRLLDEVHRLRSRSTDADGRNLGMVGESPPMLRLFDMIHRLHDSDATVLISGESGTGKELVARALHQTSARRARPFVAVNCAALPSQLLESELFGHARGAFTDARRARHGLLAQADGGTILLDEIAEIPIEMQPKLLRALQERRVRPLGSNEEVSINVRVLAATNRDLEAMVEEQTFREDLYYRVNVVQLRVPPLRARGRGILTLAQHFIDKIRARDGKDVRRLSAGAGELIMQYDWPGNVRELENSIERAFALARTGEIMIEDLPDRLRTFKRVEERTDPAARGDGETIEELERHHIEQTLIAAGGNKTQAAEMLGISRRSLYRKLSRYGIATGGSRRPSTPGSEA